MNRSWIKRVVQGTNYFTDFKHHPESWRNSKKLRARHDRRKLKQMLPNCGADMRGEQDADVNT